MYLLTDAREKNQLRLRNVYVSRNKIEFHQLEKVRKKRERIWPVVGDNGGCTAAMGAQLIKLQQDVLSQIERIKKPSLICTGTGDKIAAPSGSYLAHEKIQNSILKEYEGAFHLLHDELDETTEQYITDLLAFIQDNL